MKMIIDIPDYNLDDVQNGSIACGQILKAVKNGKPYMERPHGEWVYVHPLQEDDGGAYMCSVCNTGDWNILGDENFCSYCGAEMSKGGTKE